MNKLIFLLACLLIARMGATQSLVIHGNVIFEDNNPQGATIQILKNGNPLSPQNVDKKGQFELKLALQADYKLTFEKTGYIPKIVSINTEIPEEILESNPDFPPIKLQISLYPSVTGVDLSIFDQPVAIFAYTPELDDFDSDKDYSDKIRSRIAQAEQAVRQELASRSAAALAQERRYAELVSQGQQSYDDKEWENATTLWTQALEIKPGQEDLQQKIAAARQEAEADKLRQIAVLQKEKACQTAIASADSLFALRQYETAREKYLSANRIDKPIAHASQKIQEIDDILSRQAKEKAEREKQLATLETKYNNLIKTADQCFAGHDYEKAIGHYREALQLKAAQSYPQEMIAKANTAMADLKKQQAAEAEKMRQQEERLKSLRLRYTALIAEADKAFQSENYSVARLKYSEAERLQLNESYPSRQIKNIDDIIHSAKYKAKLTAYNQNKALAEKNLLEKNYAASKAYYQKALALLSVDQEEIDRKIAEIDATIEAIRAAEIEKAYRQQIDKADEAFRKKAYAVARFYYKKALEIKKEDPYASERLAEVEKNIGARQEKSAEL